MFFRYRNLFLTASLLMLPCSFLHAQTASLTVLVSSTEAAAGAEAAVPIALKDAASLGALHAEVRYDPAVLEFRGVSKGSLLSGNAMLDSSHAPGRLILGLVSLDPINGDGSFATARFTVKGSAGQAAPLKLESLRAWDQKTHAELLVAGQDGQVKIVSASPLASMNLSTYLPWLIAGGALLVLLIVLIGKGRRRRS